MALRCVAPAILACSTLLFGCGGQKHVTYYVPPDEAAPAPAPSPVAAPIVAANPQPAPSAAQAQPTPALSSQPVPSCPLLFRATATPLPKGKVAIALRAENLSGGTVSFTLPDNCPSGPLALRGLGQGYDYYGACNAGACPGPRKSVSVTLAPGQARDIATTTLSLDGGACTPALQPGRALVDVVAPEASVATCTVGTSFEVPRAAASPAAKPATPTTGAPAPSNVPVAPRPAPVPPIPAPGPR